jgi:hypothetical protein
MEWTADVAAGEWVREGLDETWASMHHFVPHGFEAYARVFHPASRSRPIGDTWPPLPYDAHRREWEAFTARAPEIETLPATWADAAAAFGTELHGLAQWGSLVRAHGDEPDPNGWQQVNAPDGWQFDAPQEGQVDAAVLSAVADVLAQHTTTPDDGYVALWEGWGGLVGAMGWGPSRAFFTFSEGGDETTDAAAARHGEFLAHSARDQFENPFGKPSWQPGILPDDVSKGPRLRLPDRDHVLFRGGVAELADPRWQENVPWRDRVVEERGFPVDAVSPSLVWPADRAWVLVSEVDYDSTIVAGTNTVVRALCADPRLEALPIREGSALTWASDEVNR